MIIFYYVKFTVTNILFVEIQIGKHWHVLSIRKSIRIPRAIVEHLHPGLLQCKITVYFISLCNVLKPDKLEWALKGKILEIVLTFEWNLFEPIGTIEYIRKMWIATILGQNIARLCQQCSLWTAKMYHPDVAVTTKSCCQTCAELDW